MINHQTYEEFEVRDLARGAAAGAIGGLLASWVMNKAHAAIAKAKQPSSSSGAKKKQQSSQSEEPATVKTAVAISKRVLHHRLTKREKQIAEPIIHYGYGAMMGAAYGAVAEVLPQATIGRGTVYASGLWFVGDEIAVPALGLSKSPTSYPVSTHAQAFATHVVYGLVLEAGRRAARPSFHR